MIRKELGANFGRIILDLGLRDEGHWAQNVEGYMRELPNLGSMSETAPILIQLKQWCEKKWVSVSQFKTVTEEMQKRIQNMSILQICPHSSTVGQQSGCSAAAVDNPAQKCKAVRSGTNDSVGTKVVFPSCKPFLTQIFTKRHQILFGFTEKNTGP